MTKRKHSNEKYGCLPLDKKRMNVPFTFIDIQSLARIKIEIHVAKKHSVLLAKFFDDEQYSDIYLEGTCISVIENYAYVTVEFSGSKKKKNQIREILSKNFNMMTEIKSKDSYNQLLSMVSIHIPESDEDLIKVSKIEKNEKTYKGELMEPKDFKGFTLIESTVKVYDKDIGEFIIGYESNCKEFNEMYDSKYTIGEKYCLHLEGIDRCPEIHSNTCDGQCTPKGTNERIKLNRSGDFKNEDSPVYMQGYRVDLSSKEVGKYSWDQNDPNYFAKSLKLYQTMSKVFQRFLPEIALEQEKLLLNVPKFEGSIHSNAAISKNYYSRIHLDSQEYFWTHIIILRRGTFRGGWICFPEYKLAFEMNYQDSLFFQSQKLIHETGPFYIVDDSSRIGIATQINERIYFATSKQEK
eukprot:gene7154-11467_t